MSNRDLSFATLRQANACRLPQFKNNHGEICHSQADGSDWTPAEWIEAWCGEIGELAMERVLYEEGKTSFDDFAVGTKKEHADAGTYQDIAARRALDTVQSGTPDAAQVFVKIIASLGMWANLHKKYRRGDLTPVEFEGAALPYLAGAMDKIEELICLGASTHRNLVVTAHPIGVDLGIAITNKFNEVSERVGSNVLISNNGVHFKPAAAEVEEIVSVYLNDENITPETHGGALKLVKGVQT